MNNIFKQSKKEIIVLDNNYTLTPDPFKGIILTFSEMREREKVDEKRKKTGEKEQYLYEQAYYYPSVGLALKKYVELSQNSAKSLEEIIEKTDKILAVVEEFKEKYSNWS